MAISNSYVKLPEGTHLKMWALYGLYTCHGQKVGCILDDHSRRHRGLAEGGGREDGESSAAWDETGWN